MYLVITMVIIMNLLITKGTLNYSYYNVLYYSLFKMRKQDSGTSSALLKVS